MPAPWGVRAVGIGPGRTPSTEATGAERKALAAAVRAGARLVTRAVAHVNAYSGAVTTAGSSPRRYIGDYGRNWLGPRRDRAVRARRQHGGGDRVSVRSHATVAGGPCAGHRATGSASPAGKLPPADAFWSLTMYDADGYLHPNSLHRYAIGDRTAGLRRGRDGSLTLAIQSARPKGSLKANWLPAPSGRFRMIMRIYEPRRSALSGRWRPPPVVRLPD